MKIYTDLYSTLNRLITSINSCNFIPYDSKKDIVQDIILIILNKINEGVLEPDIEKIKGYTFISLQNACRAWHRFEMKRETPVSEFWEIKDNTELEAENREYKEYLASVVRNYIQQHKYDEIDRQVCEMLLEDYSDDEIRKTVNISKELGKHKFRIKTKLKFDVKRPVKYIIKNIHNSKLQIPCFCMMDVKNYLNHLPPRRVTSLITEGFVERDGYYIETVFKRIRKRKGSSK